jgi:GxxExxY protein
MTYNPTSEKEEYVAKQIVDSAYVVHKTLGPGLLEKIYERCLCHELTKRKLAVKSQEPVPIVYDEIKFDDALRLDVLVEDLVICEIKASEQYNEVWEAQLLSYMKLTGKRLGLLINFSVPVIKKGIKRFIL